MLTEEKCENKVNDDDEEKWAAKQIEFDFPSFVFEYEINWKRK